MIYIVGGLLILVIVFFFKKQTASTEVYSRFGLSLSSYRLLSTDLGKSEGRIKLSSHGINGIADAVFEKRTGNEIHVGEFKSRKYRNIVKIYELYQVILYMGHLKAEYPRHKITGSIAYADGHVQVNFDPVVYSALLGLRGEFWNTVKSKRVVDSRPLHKRMNVSGQNRGLKLSAKL